MPIDDYSNTISGSYALTLGVARSGAINIASDVDYFKVGLVQGQRYLFTMDTTGLGAVDYGALRLQGADGWSIESGSSSDLVSFSYIAAETKTYYLQALSGLQGDTGTYSIQASLANVVDDFADDRASAAALTLGSSVSGAINIVSDVDYFKVDLVQGQRLLIFIQNCAV